METITIIFMVLTLILVVLIVVNRFTGIASFLMCKTSNCAASSNTYCPKGNANFSNCAYITSQSITQEACTSAGFGGSATGNIADTANCNTYITTFSSNPSGFETAFGTNTTIKGYFNEPWCKTTFTDLAVSNSTSCDGLVSNIAVQAKAITNVFEKYTIVKITTPTIGGGSTIVYKKSAISTTATTVAGLDTWSTATGTNLVTVVSASTSNFYSVSELNAKLDDVPHLIFSASDINVLFHVLTDIQDPDVWKSPMKSVTADPSTYSILNTALLADAYIAAYKVDTASQYVNIC